MTCMAVLLAIAYLSVFFSPAQAWILVPLEIIFWPLVIINTALLIWALARHSGSAVIPAIALLPACFFAGRFFQFRTNEAIADGSEVKIVSYNAGRFLTHNDKYKYSACVDSVFAFLKRTDADIICLQEFYIPNNEGSVKKLCNSKLPGYSTTYWTYTGAKGGFGNVILSKRKALSKGYVEFESSSNLAVWADFNINGRKIRVFNCHLESYNISPTRVIRSVISRNDKSLEVTGQKMKRSIRQRARQVDQVFSEIDNSPVESIICGDFNDTPLSYTYQKTIKGHTDCYREAGKGFGASYPATLPVIRLDYILAPDSMETVFYESPYIRFSDHRPVIATIRNRKN